MQDMCSADIVYPYEEQLISYNDGSTRKVLISDQEIPFPEGKLIVSRTDLSGIITHANPSFIEMSAYSEEEIINTPHSILRHPDMPRAAFKDLWDTITHKKKWHGYVKNLRKDGAFYWVYATVIPNIRAGEIIGYTSVRRKPSFIKVSECVSLYAKMLKREQSK